MLTIFSYILLVILSIKFSIVNRLSPQHRPVLFLIWLVISVCMVVLQWTTTAPPNFDLYGDFNDAYYLAGQTVLQDPGRMYTLPENGLQFVNIPIIALLFVPFAQFDKATAGILFLVLGFAAIIAAYFLLIKLTNASGWQKLTIATLFIVNGPLHYSLRMGNTSHFVLLCLVGALMYLSKDRHFLTGILLAIAALIKLPLLLLGVYFLVRRRWQVCLGFSTTLISVFATSILVLGLSSHKTWIKFCIISLGNKVITAFNSQSISSFLARLTMGGDLQSWVPRSVDGNFKLLLYGAISIVMSAIIYYLWRSERPITVEQENTEFSITLCLALLLSTISWTHYYLLLLIPMVLYFRGQLIIPRNNVWRALTALSFLLISLPVLNVTSTHSIWNDLVSKFLVSHYLLGAFLLVICMLTSKHNAPLPHLINRSTEKYSNPI